MSTSLKLISIYLPLLLLMAMPFIIFKIKRKSDKEISVDIFSLIQIPIPLNVSLPVKGIYLKWLVFFILFFLVSFYYINLDFSKFFPDKVEMTVHFNEKHGMDKLLKEIGTNEINGLQILNDR